MTAATASRAATSHIGIPDPMRRARTCWSAWRAIGAGPLLAFVVALKAAV